MTGKNAGFVQGRVGGIAAPNSSITRAEALKILLEGTGHTIPTSTTTTLLDIPATAWYVNYVGYAEANGFIRFPANGNFNPNAAITRDEFAQMAAVILL